MFAVVEWAGAVGVLTAFALSQTGRLPTAGYPYQAINFVSGVGLAAAGVASGQWGFVTLNGAWAVIAAFGLVAHHDALGVGNVRAGPD